jgi:hypothetical protein
MVQVVEPDFVNFNQVEAYLKRDKKEAGLSGHSF